MSRPPDGTHPPPSAGQQRAYLWLAILSGALVLTGIQAVLPALPAIQAAFDLSDGQVSLILSVYLLPGVALAPPAGLLADKLGRRRVFVAATGTFAIGGAVLLAWHAFPVLLAVRVVQGACFAAILPLSITMIGDLRRGVEGVRYQGYRSVTMSSMDATLPIVGGALVGLAWYAPFALNLLLAPLAVAAWVLLPDHLGRVDRRSARSSFLALKLALTRRDVVPLHVAAMGRFFFKYGLLTYFPLVAQERTQMSLSVIGVTIGASAFLGTLASGAAGWLARVIAPWRWMILSLLALAASLLGVAVAPTQPLLIAAMLVNGFFDGTFAVFMNAFVADIGEDDTRASISAMNGTMRNLGKFVAPVVAGALVLAMPIAMTFVVLAVLAVLTIPLILPLRDRDLDPAASRGRRGVPLGDEPPQSGLA